MRLGKIVVLSAFLCASIANAQDVMVDLSVLDDLEAPTSNVSKPLFPVLPKTPKVEVKKVKPKQKNKKVQNLWGFEAVKPADDDIVVVDVEPTSNEYSSQPKEQTNNYNKNRYEKYAKPVFEQKTKDTVAVASETSNFETEIVATPDIEKVKETAVVQNSDETVSKPVNEEVLPKIEEVVSSEQSNSDLIIKEDTIKNTDDNYISFADDVDELNDSQMSKIDLIVSSFKNEPKNKIAIYSYNYDDGVDSFKKKRVALNRAVEVRSYLLKKGYKNFSIKVVNINSPSDKLNMVELQEI